MEAAVPKLLDEKEIFLIKTGATGAPKIEIMWLSRGTRELQSRRIAKILYSGSVLAIHDLKRSLECAQITLLSMSARISQLRLFRSWKSRLTSAWAISQSTICSWKSLMFWTLMQAYLFKTGDELAKSKSFSVIVSKFKSLLIANGCQLNKLKYELHILRGQVTNNDTVYVPWPKKHALGLQNILHVIETDIALPIGYAESERVFSFLLRVFNK